MRAFENLL